MSGRIEAMTAESAANSKRKNAPKEDEDDDSGSDAGSDVVSRLPFLPHSDLVSTMEKRPIIKG